VLTRRFHLARMTAAAEVAVLLGGWALAQYPYLVVDDFTFKDAAASPLMLKSALITYAIGGVFLIPSLILLFAVFKGLNPAAESPPAPSSGE
jgi:cytochrome d ubiquinol oxidase subunit II